MESSRCVCAIGVDELMADRWDAIIERLNSIFCDQSKQDKLMNIM